ncbi:hypothetical protein LO772_35455 [Yinghuangia sp. ASG 101]|uniref:hypothetical protein n=1 Tax=Yinghuangia sp. ASG 101 TaxID=2896848 RepID=UPI001E372464|nr:hypothetical protein [Yinghuangia sp. ASG 101]UGQ11995.1 hypothetical protein LO772_35455 [Yinghuangia sp. ASG 101]
MPVWSGIGWLVVVLLGTSVGPDAGAAFDHVWYLLAAASLASAGAFLFLATGAGTRGVPSPSATPGASAAPEPAGHA